MHHIGLSQGRLITAPLHESLLQDCLLPIRKQNSDSHIGSAPGGTPLFLHSKIHSHSLSPNLYRDVRLRHR